MSKADLEALAQLIADTAEPVIRRLFETRETFYYLSLLTTGEGHVPTLSAWSFEALGREVQKYPNDDTARQDLKWSHADSPYYAFLHARF